MSIEDYFDRRSLLGAALSILALGVLVAFLGYQNGTYSLEEASFYVQSLGVIATTLFVVVYLIIIQREDEEEEKNREAQLMEDMTAEILQPAIETAERNARIVREGQVDWGSGPGGEELLEILVPGRDPKEVDRLSSENSDVYQQIRTHDSKYSEFRNKATPALMLTSQNVTQYLDQHHEDWRDMDVSDPPWKLSYYLLNGTSPETDSDLFGIWTEDYSDLHELTEETHGEVQAYWDLQNEYKEVCDETARAAREYRNELREEHSFSLNDVR